MPPPDTQSFAHFSPKNIINIAGSATRETFDEAVDQHYKQAEEKSPLLISLRRAQYIDVALLCHCISFITYRLRVGHPTVVAWPTKKEVRDFLNVWRFGEALSCATGIPFKRLLIEEDHQYIEEPQITYSGYGNALKKLEFNSDWRPGQSGLRNFFEFVTYKSNSSDKIKPDSSYGEIPRTEGARWSRPLVQAVLQNHLAGGSSREEIARVVIYESISNAVRHPEASVLQAVSQFQTSHKDKVRGHLRICVWDDGEGIISTLRNALSSGRSIHAIGLPLYMCDRYHVTTHKFSSATEPKHYIVDQSERFGPEVTDARLLLGSLFPGVSRNAHRGIPQTPRPEGFKAPLDAGEIIATSPGMGLYALQRTAIDLFGGRIQFRTGKYRLELVLATTKLRREENVRYACTITEYPQHIPAFLGNLLIIQLPLKAKENEAIDENT